MTQYKQLSSFDYNVSFKGSVVELREPNSEPETIVRYKATLMPNVFVDHTVIEIDHPKAFNLFSISNFNSIKDFVGCDAIITVYLAICQDNIVRIYSSSTAGTIVEKQVDKVGEQKNCSMLSFDSWFQPFGSNKTLSEMDCMNEYNPRRNAFLNWKKGLYDEYEPLYEWNGEFQNDL